jgi:hypothetical protein
MVKVKLPFLYISLSANEKKGSNFGSCLNNCKNMICYPCYMFQGNRDLSDVTHVVVDEVHERTILVCIHVFYPCLCYKIICSYDGEVLERSLFLPAE